MRARRGTKGETIQARVTARSKQMIGRYAEEQGVTDSEVVRRLIDAFVEVLERKEKDKSSSGQSRFEGVTIGQR